MNSPESTLERDLRAIDEALEGAPRDPRPEVAALQDLALALSADAPRPDAEFAELLRGAREGGLPGAGRIASGRASARLRPPRLQGLVPALGFAGLLLVALCVAVVALPNGDSGSGAEATTTRAARPPRTAAARPSPWPRQSRRAASRLGAAKAEPGAPAADAVQSFRSAPVPPGGFAPGRSDRKIERSVSLELATPADRMERLGEQVTAVTNRYGGFVLSSSLSTGEDNAGGEFDLRIPAARLRARAARPRRPGHGALAEPVRPRRHARST